MIEAIYYCIHSLSGQGVKFTPG